MRGETEESRVRRGEVRREGETRDVHDIFESGMR